MKKITLILVLMPFFAQAQLKNSIKSLTKMASQVATKPGQVAPSEEMITAGLKEALNKGLSEQVSKLALQDGFLKNELVKIGLPSELQQVDANLRRIGMGSLADEGVKLLNRAAESAVKEAVPILTKSITLMTISDAKSMLLGKEDAATMYLQSSTQKEMEKAFQPIIQQSLSTVGADIAWSKLISRYNSIPFVSKVNPDLTNYVNSKTLDGIYKVIAVEEKNIRSQAVFRTTDLLKSVFSLQDVIKK